MRGGELDETTDVNIGIRTSCEMCPWVSDSHPYGMVGEAAANDQLAEHQINDHPRNSEGVRLGVYMDEPD